MQIKWRKWNRAIHRDLGYLFFGMTIIYCLSGIAINHREDWNPNYMISTQEIELDEIPATIDKEFILGVLKTYEIPNRYLNHYFPSSEEVKIFLKNGTLFIDLTNGEALLEVTVKRPFFKAMNYLHYDPVIYWTWFSDIFSGALIIIAISGLFILKGSRGITKRGSWLTLLGIAIPIIFLIIYYYKSI